MTVTYAWATQNDVDELVQAIYDIWLHQDNGSHPDAHEADLN